MLCIPQITSVLYVKQQQAQIYHKIYTQQGTKHSFVRAIYHLL